MTKKVQEETPKTPEQIVRDKISEVLGEENIGTSIVIFTHKDCTEPQVWRKGHWYDSAALMAEVLNAYKLMAVKDLGL